ncbi:MAG: hypothetical protein IPM74_02345 [Crocinitomicaceae bacterium]|nr:hypothetical protein [Crocinitomicaceae bacterium]MBK8924756.1 hypothetical protein [Crocinitomicaceae bacterium]
MIFDAAVDMSAKKNYLIFILLSFSLSGCFWADNLFITPEPEEKEISLQREAQKSVQNYIRSGIGTSQYTSVGFKKIVIHVPQEIAALEEIEADRDAGNLTGPEVDSMIYQRKKYIEEQGIERSITIDHFFTIRDTNSAFHIIEATFYLNDTLGVKSFDPLMSTDVDASLETAFNYFFKEFTLFDAIDINEARKMSNQFYSFYKTKLDTCTDITTKSRFYAHCLYITELVRLSGTFNPGSIAQSMATSSRLNGKDPLYHYEDVAFSPVYEKSENGFLRGYYIFHKFRKVNTEGVADTLAMQVDFSPYFEIISRTYLTPPFENYFE